MKNIFALVIALFILLITSGCTNTQTGLLLNENELHSIGLTLGDWGYKISPNQPSQGMLYNTYEKAQYDIDVPGHPLAGILFIKIYAFDSESDRDEVYSRWHHKYESPTQWEIPLEENTHGEKSYLMESYDNFVLVFTKKNYIIWIEGEEEIGEDKIRAIGQLVENKIK